MSEIRTSYTRLSTWLRCPRKYRYRYLDHAPEESTAAALLFGTAVHEACEAYLNALKDGHEPVAERVHRAFRLALDDGARFAEESGAPVDWGGKSRDELVERGEAMLATFIANVDRHIRVVATEIPFSVEIAPGRTFDGVIDLVLDDGDGRLRVVDIKTAASAFGPDRIEHDPQPTIYIAATEHLFGAPGRVNFEYWLLLKTKKPQFRILPVVRDEGDRRELVETLDEVDLACRRGVFPRSRGFLCPGCEYARLCSAADQPRESP